MASARSLARSTTVVDSVSWTAIAAPIYGNFVVLTPAPLEDSVKFRTTDSDANTEFTLQAGVQKAFNIPAGATYGFVPGETVIYAQATSGTQVVYADWS